MQQTDISSGNSSNGMTVKDLKNLRVVKGVEDLQQLEILTNWDNEIDWDSVPNVLEEISNYVFISKYARYLPKEQRRETWEEAVDRVKNMHLKKFKGDKLNAAQRTKIRWAFDMVRDKKVLPSMRCFQFAGPAVEQHNARSYNCSVRHIDSIRAFAEVFYLLLCGSGVGIGVTKKHVRRIPNLVSAKDRTGTVIPYIVQDDIEGWADSVEALLLCYTRGNPFSGRKIAFDYSRIRLKGAPLKIGGGKAPGYLPLKLAHQKIKRLLEQCIEVRGQQYLRPIDVYDILMHTSDAVLSGGIRRSATIVIFDKDDEDMLTAKSGNWFDENPQRARSNNSVLLLRNQISFEEFAEIIQRTREWGEPGFVFADHEDMLYNPCAEIGFIPVTKDGRTGVQFCNLTSVNSALVKSEEDYLLAAEAASIIGTLQATYTVFPYLSAAAAELTQEEALLGVSMTAMMEQPKFMLDPVLQQKAAKRVVETNELWAEVLGINQAARATCVKPEGSGSLVVGTMASGIHAAEDHWMFRRVQANKIDPVYMHFKEKNPHMCEESIWSTNKTDDVIMFPVRVSDSAMVKRDLDALGHLSAIKSTQENWVLMGTTKANTKPVTHNVSCTVRVGEDEWDVVANYLYFNRGYFGAVSLIPADGDKIYIQAPVESVATEEEFQLFKHCLKNMKSVDYTTLVEFEDMTEHVIEASCAGGSCDLM